MIDELDFHDLGGTREGARGRLRIAMLDAEGDVLLAPAPHQRRAVDDRALGVGDRRQRLPVDLDRFGCVLRGVERIGNDEGHRIADEARLVPGEHGEFRHPHFFLVLRLDLAEAGKRREIGDIGGGENEADARLLLRGLRVGDAKARMRMGRAQNHRVERAVGGMVGDVAAGAADESVVLFARERPAETELGWTHGTPRHCRA